MALRIESAEFIGGNQRALMRDVALVRAALERYAGTPVEARAEPQGPGVPSCLDRICETFSLSSFERKILVACAAVDLDGGFASLCAIAQGDPARAYPTFGLALAAFDDAHWSALAPQAPLRSWSLISVGRDAPLTFAPLRIDESILHELAGVPERNPQLRPFLARLPEDDDLAPSQRVAIDRIAQLLNASAREALVQLTGPDPAATAMVARAAFAAIGADTLAVDGRTLPRDPREIEELVRVWSREALLHGSALYIDAHGIDETPELMPCTLLAEKAASPVALGVDRPLAIARRPAYALAIGKPLRGEQRELWRQMLGTDAAGDLLAAQFDFAAHRIRATSVMAQSEEGEDLQARAWSAACANARAGLDTIAQRLDCGGAGDALVLPARQSNGLCDIIAFARNRMHVYEDWGMGLRAARGLGLSALFHGPSGTGKTLGAEAIGAALALDLYRVDLSQLVSKYIGETEKNLRRVFDAAEDGGAILLFDECDAIFGKRGEIQYGHDRYANVEVSYLLQRMEAYRGVAILTTNMRSAIDPAFLRRIRFVIDFPFPDYEQRLAIWRRSFAPSVPIEGLDFTKVARLNVTGGSIRNIALHAAFLAADAKRGVRMSDVERAARAECLKMERTPSELEIGGWV